MPRKLSKGNNELLPDDPSVTDVSSSSTLDTTAASPPAWLHDTLPLPRLIVLDLDYTLWPFYSDIHISTPVRSTGPTSVRDRNGESFSLYPDAPHILHLLSSLPASAGRPVRLAVASKSPVGDLCREVLKLLRLPSGPPVGMALATPPPLSSSSDGRSNSSNSSSSKKAEKGGRKTLEVFDGGLEIYEGSKLRHFEVISRRTGIPYHEMLFFDDERPNRVVEQLGVTMRLVESGLTWAELDKGIQQWRANRGIA